MIFKRMLRAFGVGGPTIETVLDSADAAPGGVLTGRVEITGGDHDTEIDEVLLFLQAAVEHEYEHEYENSEGEEVNVEGEFTSTTRWAETKVCDAFSLPAGERVVVEFEMPVPFETPVTAVGGEPVPGPAVGVRTRLSVDRALDTGDLDPIAVHALPVHERVLAAFADLGFSFTGMDLEPGELVGTGQRLGFHQEIEFAASPRYGDAVGDVELSFVTDEEGAHVVLQIGALDDGGRVFRVSHAAAENEDTDWTGLVEAQLTAGLP